MSLESVRQSRRERYGIVSALHRGSPSGIPRPSVAMTMQTRGVRGVGGHLKAILGSVGIPSCNGCNTLASELDARGPDWAQEHEQDIVGRMVSNANQQTVTKALSWAAGLFGFREATLSSLLHLAIARASADVVNWRPDSTAPITTRSLIYHVYPRLDSDVWEWNLSQLLQRIDLFNGRRVLAVAVDDKSHPIEAVAQYVAGHDIEIMPFRNDPGLREMVSMLRLLETVWTTNDGEAVFYGHSKGVTRHLDTSNRGMSLRWAEMMYGLCLDNWDHVARHLHGRAAAGPFLKVGVGFRGSGSMWHFSGTFYWFRPSTLFARNWRKCDSEWFGAESYLSLHIRVEEAAALLITGAVPDMDFYNPAYVDFAEREYHAWKKACCL